MYWIKKKKPLLVSTHVILKYHPIRQSSVLKMFSLYTWISNMDFLFYLYSHSKSCKYNIQYIQFKFICVNVYQSIYASKDNLISVAFYDQQTNGHNKLKATTTVSIMFAELLAILEALSYFCTCDI